MRDKRDLDWAPHPPLKRRASQDRDSPLGGLQRNRARLGRVLARHCSFPLTTASANYDCTSYIFIY
eukprot:7536809-Pyramimonas_sp.AAC.1